MKRKLYALHIAVWSMDNYIAFRDEDKSCDPSQSANLLFATEEAAQQYAKTIDSDSDSYNEACMTCGEVDEDTILKVSGFENMEDFDLALADPYFSDPTRETFGYNEKAKLSCYIQEELDDTEYNDQYVECANYDIDKSIDGGILVIWLWEPYIGYARRCQGVRYACGETEAFLVKQDYACRSMADLVMTKEEVDVCSDIEAALREKLLSNKDWKWKNPGFVEECINNI